MGFSYVSPTWTHWNSMLDRRRWNWVICSFSSFYNSNRGNFAIISLCSDPRWLDFVVYSIRLHALVSVSWACVADFRESSSDSFSYRSWLSFENLWQLSVQHWRNFVTKIHLLRCVASIHAIEKEATRPPLFPIAT